jgi:hypothetical protein
MLFEVNDIEQLLELSLSKCAAGALFRVTMLLLIGIAKPCVDKVALGFQPCRKLMK